MYNFKNQLIKPMLATPDQPFNREDYIFEVKWDGYRAIAYLSDETKLKSRNLKDFTDKYINLQDLHKKVSELPVVLDGEIIALEGGKPSFQEMQANNKKPLIFMAFDIMYYKGKSVMDRTLLERKKLLEEVITEDSNLLVSQHIEQKGIEFFKRCIDRGLEGIIAKQIDSRYLPGKRVDFWKKIKGIKEDDFVVVGFLPGKDTPIGSLVLGSYKKEKLIFKGLVGTGISEKLKRMMLELFGELKSNKNPFKTKLPELYNAKFMLPHLVCTVKYLEETQEGRLRHPSFKELRGDKFASDLQEEGRSDN